MMTDEPGVTDPEDADPTDGSTDDATIFRGTSGPDDPAVPFLAPGLPPYFIPRAELRAIKKLLLERPTASLAPLTLHGPGGSGKSALAAALAHDADILRAFPNGVLWASPGADSSAAHIQALWGEALGVELRSLPDPTDRATALRTALRDARMLIILDDVTDIEQVRALNVGGPGCARIITTDEAGSISYAIKTRRYVISRMRPDEALHLLAEWAGILPDIYLPTVEEIIQRLSYSPLALALVGGQARQGITWLRLLEVLRDDQGPLATLNIDAPETRHRALRVVISLVLSRFGGMQLQRSTLLAVFVPGAGAPFSTAAAAACWDLPPDEAESTLSALVEASLVQRLSPGSYALHPALHPHLAAAAELPALEQAARRVRDYYAALVEQGEAAGDWIDTQISQIMAAFRQMTTAPAADDGGRAVLFADALLSIFEERGLWGSLVTLATGVVEAARAAGDVFREHQVLPDLGFGHTMLGSLVEARACFERSLKISRDLGDPVGEAAALNNLGAVLERQGDYAAALEHYRQSLDLRERLGEPEDVAETLNNIAGVLYWQHHLDEALATFQRALDIAITLNDRTGQAQTWLNIGAVYERLGHDDEAEQAYQRSLAIYANTGNEAGQAQALNNLGIIFFNQGEHERALATFKRSLALKEKLGDRLGEASTLNNIALLYEKTEANLLALDHYERSFQILDALEDPRAAVVKANISALRKQMT